MVRWAARGSVVATSQKVANSILSAVIGFFNFSAALWPGVDSACNRNEYQESSWG
jgi:hypothetical protein